MPGSSPALQPLLIDALWTRRAGDYVRPAILAIVGSLLLTISAKTQVPMWPVPMTMQTFAVLVIGAAYGPRLAAGTVALYLAQGAIGLPVFAAGGGIAYFAGPTTGYLAGFLVAATVVGALAARGWDRSVTMTLAAMTIGTAIIFALGVAWLGMLIGYPQALSAGLVPFLPGAALKIALAAAVLPAAWRLVGRRS